MLPISKSVPASVRTALLAMCLAVAGVLAKERESNLRLEVARQWAGKGEYDKAVQELRVYLSEHPDSPEIYARIGGLRLKQGNFHLAAENYKIALSKDAHLKEAREGLIEVYEKTGEKEKADALRARPGPRASSIDPGFSPEADSGPAGEGEGIYAQKDFQQALRLYREKKPDSLAMALRRVLAGTPGHPGAYYLGGVMRYERGDLAKALFNFKRGTAYPERGHNAYFYLGRIHQRQGRTREAIEAYGKYLRATPSEAGRRQAEAYLAQLSGNAKAHGVAAGHAAGTEHGHPAAETEPGSHGAVPEKATPAGPKAGSEAGSKAVVMGRDGSFFFLIPDAESPSGKSLAEAYEACRNDKFEAAAGQLKETMLGYGGSANAEAAGLDLASVYLRLGLWENARDRIADYLGTSPRDSVRYWDAAQYLSALAHLGLKDGEKAEKALLKITPGSASGPARDEVDYRLAQAGELLQDVKKWSAYLEKAHAGAKLPSRRAELARQSGALYVKFGNIDKAMDYYRKSLAECKDTALADLCADSRLRLADLAFRKKDWKGAMAQYRQFAAKYPEHAESPWIQYQMANIHKATNNFESALNGYKRVIDNYPDSYWASQAKWKREDTIWQKEYEEVLD